MSSAAVERVLIYRLGSLGDHLVALPSYRMVRRAFPGAEVRLLTNVPVEEKAPPAEAVLRGTGLVDGYMAHASGERRLGVFWRLMGEIRRWKPEVLVYLAGARGEPIAWRDRVFFWMCGVGRQIGVPVTAEMQENRAVEKPEWIGSESPWVEAEGLRLARCVADLGDARAEDEANWGLELTEAERALIAGLEGRSYFGFSVGTKVQANEWGISRWIELLERIAAEWPGYGLAIVGAEEDALSSEVIAAAWDMVPGAGPALNLCGTMEPRVSAAVLERAVMYLGHDSGPGHLAAAVGTPVLEVFSARNMPGKWVPRGARVVQHWVDCGGCVLDTCVVQGKKCILSISVDEVMTAFREHAAKVGLR